VFIEDTATEGSATSHTVPSGWITQPVASTKGFWKAIALFDTAKTIMRSPDIHPEKEGKSLCWICYAFTLASFYVRLAAVHLK
jgi:hypothetical protein